MIQEHLMRYIDNQQMNVTILRKQYGFSRYMMAAITRGITERVIETYENKIRTPSTTSLITVAMTFGVSLDWIYGLSDEPYTRRSVMNAQFEYEQEFNETISLKRDVKYKMEAVANIIVLKRAIKYLKETKSRENTDYIKTLENRVESIIATGRPEYRIE